MTRQKVGTGSPWEPAVGYAQAQQMLRNERSVG